MKKDLNWLKNKLEMLVRDNNMDSSSFSIANREAYSHALDLVEQLDESIASSIKIDKDGIKVTGNNVTLNDNPIKPAHYRRGQEDLFESWYKRYPFNEYRSIMQSHAEKYINRNKTSRVEDLEKAIYVLERLLEKEREQDNQ